MGDNISVTGMFLSEVCLQYSLQSAGRMIERLKDWILAGVVGEFSSQELTLCADSYLVSVLPPCYCSGTKKTPVILSKAQLAGYTKTGIHLWPNAVRVGWLCCCPDTVWEPVWKQAHKQPVRDIQPQSSQLAKPLWTACGIKSGISLCKLNST